MLNVTQAMIQTFVMAAVIFFCRAFPFLVFGKKEGASDEATAGTGGTELEPKKRGWLSFVEKVVPPVAMTVLALNSIFLSIKENLWAIAPVLVSAVLTAIIHIWKRNALISIMAGTCVYMVLNSIFMH